MCSVCSIWSVAYNHRQVQSKTNYTEKSFWWYLTVLTVFGDTEITLGIEINIFLYICNITYYSQHVINLKVCLNTGRCAIAPHWERFLTPIHSPCYSSVWRKKWITDFLLSFFLSLPLIISHKPAEKCSVSFLTSPFLHLFSLWTVFATWIVQRALGWEKKHSLLWGCLRQSLGSALIRSV